MSPHTPTHKANGDSRTNHEGVTKDGLAREHGNDLRHHAKRRQHHDVHLGVTEDPEQMLPQERISTLGSIEECCAKHAIQGEEQERHGNNRKCKHQQHLNHKVHPGEHRHLHQRHARGTHVEHCYGQVDCRDSGPDTHDEQTNCVEVNARSGREGNPGVWCVIKPTPVCTAAKQP
ncbi:unannotated protein [freshwater metagenome]|uniref:Unannotated protein n=1 Tax=freshwater metagenome TaxID=449393 RepID=A0A6J6YVZ4_9ZZZZ